MRKSVFRKRFLAIAVQQDIEKNINKSVRVKKLALQLTLALSFFGAQLCLAAQPSLDEKLEILQKEMDEIKAEIAKNKGQPQPQTPSETSLPATQTTAPAGAPTYGGLNFGNTTVGGYGEAIYSHFFSAKVNDAATLRRFVLFFGHKFNDRLRFQSEFEVENAVVSSTDKGEAEIEQAFLDYRFNDALNVKAGLFLMPLGILNETHEPPTFYGVERNRVETVIIPTTLREGGVGVHGEVLQGLSYDFGVTTTFDSGKFDDPSQGIHNAHQELQNANANDLGVYGAVNYRGVPGLLLGTGVLTGNTGQNGASNPALKGVNARLTLWDIHAQYNVGRFHLQGLYARGTLGDALAVTQATGNTAPSAFYGWYTEAAYRAWQSGDFALSPFVRYERYNTQQGVAPGFAADPRNNEKVTTVGFNFNLHPQVVLKLDYRNFTADNTRDSVSLGVGYQF
jgi:hypothetical protein